jgi:hypothetical protein
MSENPLSPPSRTERIREIGKKSGERARTFPQLKRKVDNAEPLERLDFETLNRVDNPEIAELVKGEPGASKLFLFDFGLNTDEYYSFLNGMRDKGFDLFIFLSIPKGDSFTFNGSVQHIEQRLKGENAPSRVPASLRNKLAKRDFIQTGQLHIRLYEAPDNRIVATAHIDPPDLKEHANPKKQLGSTPLERGYPEGEVMFENILNTMRDERMNQTTTQK